MKRTRLELKKLNILRKCIYDSVHAESILRCIDKTYVIEYAIADKTNSLIKHFGNWEM
jgi:hypothetical protein